MRILIIGGAGFIGSHLCESYASDHSVTSIDNYISGKTDNHIDNVKYLDMDVKNIQTLQEDYDLIFHLGEYSRVENSLQKTDYVLNNNLRPILDILNFAKKSNAKLIYAGSSTKFADNGENKFKSPYAFSKWQNSEVNQTNHCNTQNIEQACSYANNSMLSSSAFFRLSPRFIAHSTV